MLWIRLVRIEGATIAKFDDERPRSASSVRAAPVTPGCEDHSGPEQQKRRRFRIRGRREIIRCTLNAIRHYERARIRNQTGVEIRNRDLVLKYAVGRAVASRSGADRIQDTVCIRIERRIAAIQDAQKRVANGFRDRQALSISQIKERHRRRSCRASLGTAGCGSECHLWKRSTGRSERRCVRYAKSRVDVSNRDSIKCARITRSSQ